MIYEGAVGQAQPIILAVQFLDVDGQPATPVSPELRILGGSPVVLLAGPIVPVETAGLTGFMVATLDVSDADTWPAGQYAVRWNGETSGKVTATIDYLQLTEQPAFAAGAVISGAYTTEDRIRAVSEILRDAATLTSPMVALEAERGARYIDMALASTYAVPFVSPFDPGITLLNDWMAAALCMDRFYSENGNAAAFSTTLKQWVDDALAKLASGESLLATVAPLPDAGQGAVGSSTVCKNQPMTMPIAHPLDQRNWPRNDGWRH